MREIRLSGSEGGEAEAFPTPIKEPYGRVYQLKNIKSDENG